MSTKLKILLISLVVIANIGMNANAIKTSNAKQVTQPDITSTSSVASYVSKEAIKLGINPEVVLCTLTNESMFDPHSKGDIHDKKGASLGLWQWNTYWHPEVGEACSYDVECSTKKALAWIKAGHIKEWSGYRARCTSIPVFQHSNVRKLP